MGDAAAVAALLILFDKFGNVIGGRDLRVRPSAEQIDRQGARATEYPGCSEVRSSICPISVPDIRYKVRQ